MTAAGGAEATSEGTDEDSGEEDEVENWGDEGKFWTEEVFCEETERSEVVEIGKKNEIEEDEGVWW